MVSDDIGYSATSIGKKKFCRTCGIGCSMVGIRTAPAPVAARARGNSWAARSRSLRQPRWLPLQPQADAKHARVALRKEDRLEATLPGRMRCQRESEEAFKKVSEQGRGTARPRKTPSY